MIAPPLFRTQVFVMLLHAASPSSEMLHLGLETAFPKTSGSIFNVNTGSVWLMNQQIKANVSNKGWFAALQKAGIKNFRFHDLRHTWASWHRQAGTSCDELKELGGWKTRSMVDRYAKFATEHLANTAS